MPNYEILVKAIIDSSSAGTASVQTSLDVVAKSITLTISKATFDKKAIDSLITQLNSAMSNITLNPKIAPTPIVGGGTTGGGGSGGGGTISGIPSKITLDDLKNRLGDILSTAQKLGNVKIFQTFDETGENLTRVVSTFSDGIGKTVVETSQLVDAAGKYTTILKDATGLEVSRKTSIENSAKQEKILADATQKTSEFLAKAANYDQGSAKVQQAIAKANQIKGAVAAGDIQSVQRLTKELDILKQSLVNVSGANEGWITGIKRAMKQTFDYAVSVGLIYGALAQLKKAMQYIADLNKEMTNIQLLQVEGGSTNAEISDLAKSYNELAIQLGATTLEVSKGSVEWFNKIGHYKFF
jgi:hypothetical protein